LEIEMNESEKPAAPAEVRIVRDLATGKVVRIITTLADGSIRVLYHMTQEQIDEVERELTAPRH
jgi:hypothetical protein